MKPKIPVDGRTETAEHELEPDGQHEYYATKYARARLLRAAINTELTSGNPDSVLLDELRRELDLAEYVGD